MLVADGARVVLSGRTSEPLDAAVTELGDKRGRAWSPTTPTPTTPARLLAAARDTWGRVDGALISVGGPPQGLGHATITDEQWTDAFGSVFLGAVRLAREIGRRARATAAPSRWCCPSSVRAPLAGMAISNGLRPGLAMVAKTLADELGPAGVRVNGLLPGRVATERVAELDAAGGDPDAARARAVQTIPLGRYGEPEEFGRAAAFLLSPAASFVSGAMLPGRRRDAPRAVNGQAADVIRSGRPSNHFA